MCGTELAASVVGRYSTAEGAYRQQERGEGLSAILRQAGAIVLRSPMIAMRGDVLIGRRDRFECGHLIVGRHAISSDPDHGVLLVEIAALNKEPIKACRY